MAVNGVLTTTKFIAGILGHSHALVADAVESLADIISSLIVWRGLVVASEPADEDHPYGHGKAEPIAAAVVATMLLLAAGWIMITAFGEIRSPHQAPAPFTLVVLILVVLTKESLFRFVLSESVSVQSTVVQTDAWHHRSDAITSAAAGIGIGVALIGGPGYESADDYAAMVAAVVIAFNGWRLLRPAMNELMDRTPTGDIVDRIPDLARSIPGVENIEKCFIRKMGYHYFVDMHVEVNPDMTVSCSHRIAHEVKDKVRNEIPAVYDVLVHIEPRRSAAPAPDPASSAEGSSTSNQGSKTTR